MKLDLDFLRTVVLFSDLPDEELQIVSDIFKEDQVPAWTDRLL